MTAWIDAQVEPKPATVEKIENMIARLALATKERPLTPAANAERLDIYWRVLRVLPLIDLASAFDELLRTMRFMPTPAEIYQAAMKAKVKREWPVERAKHLVWLHKRDWHPPIAAEDIPSAEEVRSILREVDERFASRRNGEDVSGGDTERQHNGPC